MDEKGIDQGVRDVVLRQLRTRPGSLDSGTEPRIAELPVEQIEHLAEARLDFSSPSDLKVWLKAHVGHGG